MDVLREKLTDNGKYQHCKDATYTCYMSNLDSKHRKREDICLEGERQVVFLLRQENFWGLPPSGTNNVCCSKGCGAQYRHQSKIDQACIIVIIYQNVALEIRISAVIPNQKELYIKSYALHEYPHELSEATADEDILVLQPPL